MSINCPNPIHVGDVGTTFRLNIEECLSGVDTAVDVSGATTKQIIFRKPGKTLDTQTAAFTTDGTNGQIEYVSQSGDIDAAGQWSMQGKVILAAGTFFTSPVPFRVDAILAAS